MPRKRPPKSIREAPAVVFVEVLEETDPPAEQSPTDTLMLAANGALQSARIDEWLSLTRIVEKTLRGLPSGRERDGVEKWLLRQWKRPEWVEP